MKLNQETFVSLIFQWLQHDICNVGDFKGPLKQDFALAQTRKQRKEFSILTKTHINLDQIHHMRNNLLGPMIFFPGDSDHKRIAFPAKRWFVSFKVAPSNHRVQSLCALRA